MHDYCREIVKGVLIVSLFQLMTFQLYRIILLLQLIITIFVVTF